MAITFKIGQIVTANQDIKVEKALSGKEVTIKKGSKAIIGADNFAHHLSTDMIQPISKAVKIEGYDTEGLADYLFDYLKYRFPLDEFCENYDVSERSFKDDIVCALEEIGF